VLFEVYDEKKIFDFAKEGPHIRGLYLADADAVLKLLADPPADVIEKAAAFRYPHLWSGAFEQGLARLSIFTPEQAAESAIKKRAEKCELVRSVLAAAFGGERDE
jgi:hypothetical protein